MRKMKNSKGFTLVEMLIVVAIIAILIAISIPLVQKALEKSRHAVDQANIRDAIALGTIEYLTDPDLFKDDSGTLQTQVEKKYMVTSDHQGYLEGLAPEGFAGTGEDVTPKCKCEGHATDELKVTIKDTGEVSVNWKTDETLGKTTVGTTTGGNGGGAGGTT